ncbi:MAG: phosphoglycerate dehydrogenase [Actinobacteria bacterium]|nr:phosphoglycerate dehydrogenase [Actinomycetota bacterium]
MADRKRVLVKEKLAPEGVELLRQDFDVDLGMDWTDEEFMARIKDYDGLMIRSATKVTADVIAAGARLSVIGRAGVGVDNVDLKAATKRGIIVVNAPTSNVLSAAEHTIGMLMACARNIPQAHAALKAGRWERSKFGGVELMGKTLGIIGLGRIGSLVAERARALKMNVLGYDPYVPAERFREMGLDRAESPERVYREADFISVHLPKNKDTLGFVDDEAFTKMKDGVRIINVARGGIVDEEALARAIENGKVASAAIDVYPSEPTTDDILFKYDQVVNTPHLGASTKEAQLRAGVQTAEQVALVLKGQFAPNAVNVPFSLGEDADEIMPFAPVCELLGKLVVQLVDDPPESFDVEFEGAIARHDTRVLSMAVLQGALADRVEGEISIVNVANIAEERGLTVRETKQPAAVDYLNLVTVTAQDGEAVTVAGTALGVKHKPRIVQVWAQDVDLVPCRNMLFVRAKAQVPGTFGKIGAKMGEFGININQVSVGEAGDAAHEVMGLALDAPISAEQVAEVVEAAGLVDARRVIL